MEQFLHSIIKQAGDIAKEKFTTKLDVTLKSGVFDVLTDADTKVNAFLTTAIKAQYPDHNILSEEEGIVENKSDIEWIIDPIDGTWNYAHQVPIWAVMISIVQGGIPLYSAVYFPLQDTLFSANPEGAYIDGVKTVISSDVSSLSQGSIGKMFTRGSKALYEEYRDAYIQVLQHGPVRLRHTGVACELVFMLNGYIHFAFGNSGAVWDLVPTLHILQQAGTIVTDSNGAQLGVDATSYVAAANKELHTELLSFFSN